MLDIAKTTSASVHAPSVSLGTTAPAVQPMPPHAGSQTCGHADAEIIDLAKRVKRLAERHAAGRPRMERLVRQVSAAHPVPPTHASSQEWDTLTRSIQDLRNSASFGVPNDRRDEILRLHDRWRADIAAEDERSGFAAARVERQASADENADLRARICRMPARTAAGVDLKLRVIL